MSEFSETFHLRTEKQEDGKTLLNTAGTGGIVFAPTNGWVTVVPEGEIYSNAESIIPNFTGNLIHYIYASDHAWGISLYENGELESGYLCAWDPEIHIEKDNLDLSKLVPFLIDSNSESQLEQLFELNNFEKILDQQPAYKSCELLGIKHYQWLSGRDIPEFVEDILENNSDAELV